MTAVVSASEVHVPQLTAMDQSSVTIDCFNSSTTSGSPAPQHVEWRSSAWSESHQKLVIFHSSPEFAVNSKHPNADKYTVDREYRSVLHGSD